MYSRVGGGPDTALHIPTRALASVCCSVGGGRTNTVCMCWHAVEFPCMTHTWKSTIQKVKVKKCVFQQTTYGVDMTMFLTESCLFFLFSSGQLQSPSCRHI